MDLDSNKDTPIKSWWKKVTHNSNNKPTSQKQDDQIFGVPLQDSLKSARAAIAYVDNDVQYVGFIPVIVAKCGSFLKDQGLYTEGVFRMSGSAKRIGQLQQIFNTAPDYGRQLDWKGFSVHDAANVLRRFLNYLPEPVIVHQLYQPFRDVVTCTTPSTEDEKVVQFQNLIEQLPEHHQYLLFYLLDLLSLFSQNVQITKMDTFNLASVFTPGILLNPEHALNPTQYKTSQKVVQFLVEHQHCFKMPRSSWFTVLNQQQKEADEANKTPTTAGAVSSEDPAVPTSDANQEINKSSSTPTTSSSIQSPTPPAAQRHNSQPIRYNTINTFHTPISNTTTNHPYHTHQHQKSVDLSDPLTPSLTATRPLSVLVSQQKESRVKRAKTMPSRRSRYGPNDPLQVVQLNKSVIETGHNK
ncbi:Rho GTPase activation protein [Mucor lusitanicus]|uniref:Rho GTPase activation protein n=2 Tax=Mucor circinelloides f. lusitanicus TaxID=29924 RepID=A0A8H4BK95_MUCCL|nr:Rho GTPase activation protein [Mucor lusitanicus]